MNESKVLGYVPYGTGRDEPFSPEVFRISKPINPFHPETLDGCDAIVVWGGQDISPSLYGEEPNSFTGADVTPSQRDDYELRAMMVAIAKDIPIIGVCRGAQLACAVAGGKLVQHVDGHTSTHGIVTNDGRHILTSSVHHQMMYPWDVEHDLIARAEHQISHRYVGEKDKPVEFPDKALDPKTGEIIEPEIVYFPTIRALAIQGHPEFMDKKSEFVGYCNTLVQQFLLA